MATCNCFLYNRKQAINSYNRLGISMIFTKYCDCA